MFGHPTIFQFTLQLFTLLQNKQKQKQERKINHVVSMQSDLHYKGGGNTTLYTGILEFWNFGIKTSDKKS